MLPFGAEGCVSWVYSRLSFQAPTELHRPKVYGNLCALVPGSPVACSFSFLQNFTSRTRETRSKEQGHPVYIASEFYFVFMFLIFR